IIIFYGINFEKTLHIKKAFKQLNGLEFIHILECLIFNSNFIQQIIDLNKPFKLISLFIKDEFRFNSDENRNLQVELMQLLFQKFGEYLENIRFASGIDGVIQYRALEFINNYCKRIKFFDIYTFNIQKAQIVLDSVKIFGQNLNYFSIYVSLSRNETNESIMEMFSRLVHVLPCKLEYLNLHFNYQIRKNVWEEYIMKEQRTEYLAIEGRIETQSKYYYSIDWDKKELFTMTDELKEFESYNIKVKEYNNLYIKAYDKFIDEMY
ncbi:hypothetical protein RhiirA1_426560, partial [Rhizophagus irregularis]